MAYLSAFERIAISDAKLLRLEQTVRRQAADIQVLQAQIATIMPHVRQATKPEPVELARPLARMADIAARVAEENLVTLADLRGPSRTKRIAWPRQEAMRQMVDAGCSTTQVGRFLGGRDHTTVMHGARAARERVRQMEEGRK